MAEEKPELQAHATDLVSRQKHTLFLYGSWSRREMTVYLGQEEAGSRFLALSKKHWG